MTECPACGDADRPKFDRTSLWCVSCADLVLGLQAEEAASHEQDRQVFDLNL